MATRQKRKERITRLREKQILEAAMAVFTRKGFGEATVADIASEAGVAVGTIYNYYRDKHDLLISLIARSLLSANLSEILGATEATSDKKIIESLIEDRLEFGLANGQRFLFLFFEIQRNSKLRRQYLSQVVAPIISRIENLLQSGIKKNSFRPTDIKIISRALAGMIIGVMILRGLEQKDSPFKKSRSKEITKELTNFTLYGLVKK
ncbi:MAG: TetR/AcrR family transcriptional regulator [Chloroflexi bacterium]|nr:TetR/AcrR family transcriptional regulator [Chloroflexota bacterium]